MIDNQILMTSQDSLHQRNVLRKIIRSRRSQLTQHQQSQAANKLCATLQKNKWVQEAQHIALYLANDGELDPMPFIHWCWSQNKAVYLPILHPFSKGHLIFQRYQESTQMITNKFGILEPKLNVQKLCPLKQLDILFTPLVAFDTQGNRLGMGGGFYDRTLSRWEKEDDHLHENKPRPIGLAHSCQQVEQVPIEHWDIPLNDIITPDNHFTN